VVKVINVLLDTQILLFCLSSSDRLSKNQKDILSGIDYTFYVHPVSFWEIQIKYDLGKLSLPQEPELFLPPLIEKSGFIIDEFRISSIYFLSKIPNHHRDPFDRLLIAHCLEAKYHLMSLDWVFRKYPIRCIH